MSKDRLQHMMQVRGLNVAALAEISGISERHVYHILSGKGGLSDDSLLRLSQALSCSVDYLLGLVDDPTPHFRIDNLSDRERQILAAIRRGDKLTAIHILSEPEKM